MNILRRSNPLFNNAEGPLSRHLNSLHHEAKSIVTNKHRNPILARARSHNLFREIGTETSTGKATPLVSSQIERPRYTPDAMIKAFLLSNISPWDYHEIGKVRYSRKSA